jgi:SAM-dependent methyltransferase
MIAPTGRQTDPALDELFLQEAVAAGAALAAAARLGVLARLAAGPADPPALARDCAIGERGARLLLAALAGLGLAASADDGSYRAAVPDLGGLAALIAPWAGLAEAVRDDRGPDAADTPDGAAALYPGVVTRLGAMFAPLAECAADLLAAPGLRVLDAGAGAAPWSLAIARRDAGCRVTAVDLPAVLPATRRAAAAAGCDGQLTYLAGDFFALDLGAGYDLAIAGAVCHLFDGATNRQLLGRLFGALRPGGTLAVVEVLPNERLDGPRPAVLYALGLLLRTSRGQTYPFSAYAGWLRDAGYEAVERTDLGGGLPVSLITARRPAA